MQLIIILIIIFLIIQYIKKDTAEIKENEELNKNVEKTKINLKKILKVILLFVLLLYVYYFLIALITGVVLWIFARAVEGIWAYAIILGITISPILTVVTIKKLTKNKEE